MNILFVCKYNRFRSRVAEAYFNKINRNNEIKAKSAGIIEGWMPLEKTEVQAAIEMGIKLSGKPRTLSTELIKKQDKIIIVADNVPKSLFEEVDLGEGRIRNLDEEGIMVYWGISDNYFGKNESIKNIIKSIMTKVDELVEELKEVT